LQYLGVIGTQGGPSCPSFNLFGNYGALAITIGQTCVIIGTGTNPATTSVFYAGNTTCLTTLAKVEKPCTNVALSGGIAYTYGTTTGIIPTVTTCVLTPGCGDPIGKISGITISSIEEKAMEIKLYPNPNSGSFILEHAHAMEASEVWREETKAAFVLYDVSGKQGYSKTLVDSNTKENIQIDELKNGVYYYHLISNNQIPKTDKLVIIR
jgi:Secretion system C-terminal sorting domain